MKSKSGACPRCRKEIPLVPDSQGDLVLEVHHVVAIERAYGGSDVCPGTGGKAASLDDSEDWAWVTPDPRWVRDDSAIPPAEAISGLAPMAVAMSDAELAMRVLSAVASANVAPLADDRCYATSLMCGAWVGGCRCVKTPCDGAHRCACGHSWAAREYAG